MPVEQNDDERDMLILHHHTAYNDDNDNDNDDDSDSSDDDDLNSKIERRKIRNRDINKSTTPARYHKHHLHRNYNENLNNKRNKSTRKTGWLSNLLINHQKFSAMSASSWPRKQKENNSDPPPEPIIYDLSLNHNGDNNNNNNSNGIKTQLQQSTSNNNTVTTTINSNTTTAAATTKYSLQEDTNDDDDGFELGDVRYCSGGRKSPNYPFYRNFYHQTLSSYHKRKSGSNCCRLLFLISCILILLLLSVVLLIKLIVLIQQEQQRIEAIKSGRAIWNDAESNLLDKYELETGRATRWLVSNAKCHIPVIDPWHESIRSYVKKKPPMNCRKIFLDYQNKTEPPIKSFPLTYTKNNRLYFTNQAIRMGYLNRKCCYIPVKRSYENDDDLIYDEKCYLISANEPIILVDLIKILCQQQEIVTPLVHLHQQQQQQQHPVVVAVPVLNGSSIAKPLNDTIAVSQLEPGATIYTNIHQFLIKDPEEEESLNRVAGKRLDQDNYYNIVMIGVDTISRLNAYRQLNETLTRLKDNFKSLEFVGYNKVGENTFPNLIPFLTGLTPEQLTKIQCWQASNYSQETERGDDYLDNCKYLWNYYQDYGYITYFNEDWPKASTFNYLKQGFRREPTTFYGRPFTLARDNLLMPPVEMGCSSCLLDRPLVQVDLENLENFIRINKNRPYFAFHWVNCPQHDDLNGASMIDQIFDQFFKQLKSLTYDDRTFVIFFSDHGYRWNDFVSTRVGHYEASLPLLTIASPKRFIRNHPDLYENLKRHQSALLTPFDMFKTLIAIRDLAKQRTTTTSMNDKTHSSLPSSSSSMIATDDGNKQHTPSQVHIHSSMMLNRKSNSTQQQQQQQTTVNPLIFEDPQYTSGPTAATTIKQFKLLDGLSYRQSFKILSLLDANNPSQLDRSCIEAGIPDNYCVCHAFEETPTNKSDVLGAAYYLVYVHLYTRIQNHIDQCYLLDLEQIHRAELFDFKQMKKQSSTNKQRRKKRSSTGHLSIVAEQNDNNNISQQQLFFTTPAPPQSNTTDEEVIDEQLYLPSREYNIRFSTKPGSGLFQEVVRYYGQDDMKECDAAIETAREIIESFRNGNEFEKKHDSVMKMNEVCRFSVHSDSISRLNLYKDQSKCVKSNIELKKICYCNNLSL